jgi:RIO kinase 1
MATILPQQTELKAVVLPPTSAQDFHSEPYDSFEDSSDDLFGGEVDEITAEDISSANPGDYTKAYNRQRKLNDPSIPEKRKPKTNLAHGPNAAKPKANTSMQVDDQIASLSRHAGKMRLDEMNIGAGGGGGGGNKSRGGRDRADRATVEQAIDPKTRMLLLQMINRNIVSEINGCVSTGKEANVYHAVSIPEDKSEAQANGGVALPRDPTPLHRAIKVYKTAILVFKDRDKYITGEHRFRQGYQKSSSRAMVKLWAEKEMRNLKRLQTAGIPCPEPVYLRQHVLVMGFLGDKKGYPAPRLKDVTFQGEEGDQLEQWLDTYLTCVAYMRIMYQTCKLVHGDLSEYNMLYWKNKLYFIDVSQSVDHDHPRTLEFLRMDIKNVGDFFRRKGVNIFSERETFDFITDLKGPVQVEAIRERLEALDKEREDRSEEEKTRLEQEDEVFRQQYIPRTLEEVYDIERDGEAVERGEGGDLIYKELLANKLPGEKGEADAAEGAGSEDSSDSNDTDSEYTFEDDNKPPRGKRFQDKSDKKVCFLHLSLCRLLTACRRFINSRSKRRNASSERTRCRNTSKSSLSLLPRSRQDGSFPSVG